MFLAFSYFSPLSPLTEVSPQPSAIPGGNPPEDWQSAVGWGGAGFEPGTAGLQPDVLPLSHYAFLEPPRLRDTNCAFILEPGAVTNTCDSSKSLHRKSIQENVDDDILTTYVVLPKGPHGREKRIGNWFQPLTPKHLVE
jgi:hypothetical protein